MGLSVGIVGLPNVGKSTLFNALRQAQGKLAGTANYPFTTIEPNVGIVPVPDNRLAKLAEVVSGQLAGNSEIPIVPATVQFVDIAGLVKGAAEGEGLGNKFLAHIREVSLVLHVLRAFSDSRVVQTGSGDWLDDYFTIETELQIADLETLGKQSEPKGTVPTEEKARWDTISLLKARLEQGISARDVAVSDEERERVKDLFLLTSKPQMFVLNVGEEILADVDSVLHGVVGKFMEKGMEIVSDDVVIINAKLEEELSGFSESEREEYLTSAGVSMTGLEFLIKKAYRRLGLVSFLTAGEKEVRAWTIMKGMRAQDAAGVIHTDFASHFIHAKVCDYSDFVKLGGWHGAAEAGKVRQEGRDYTVRDGDVVEFVVSV